MADEKDNKLETDMVLAKGIKAIQENQKAIEDRLVEQGKTIETAVKEAVKTSEFKVSEERILADIEKHDQLLKAINAPAGQSAELQPIEGYVNQLRIEALKVYQDAGHNVDMRPFELQQKAMQSDNGPRAGYLVPPPEFVSQIKDQATLEISPIRQYAEVIKTSRDTVEIPSKTAAGVAGWVAQAGTRTEDETLTVGLETIQLHMMYAYYIATLEMLSDSAFNLESILLNWYRQAIAKLEGTAFVLGSGVGEPMGITVDPTVVAASVASGGASALTANGLHDLVYGLKSIYAGNAKFYMRRSTIGAIAKLKDAGAVNILSLPKGYTLNGFEIVECADFAAVASSSLSVAFGDLSQAYTIVDKVVAPVLIRDPYSAKATGKVEFVLNMRVGGKVTNPEAVVLQDTAAS